MPGFGPGPGGPGGFGGPGMGGFPGPGPRRGGFWRPAPPPPPPGDGCGCGGCLTPFVLAMLVLVISVAMMV